MLPCSRAAALAAGREAPAEQEGMPFRAFLRNTPVRALAYTHFCNNWCAVLLSTLRCTLVICSCGRCVMQAHLSNNWCSPAPCAAPSLHSLSCVLLDTACGASSRWPSSAVCPHVASP